MKTAEPKNISVATRQKSSKPFFSKEADGDFFGDSVMKPSGFFKPSSSLKVGGKGVLQTKLTIGQPNDQYEKEADAVADRVVQRLATPEVAAKKENGVQAKPLSIGITPVIQAKCAECEHEEKLQKKDEDELQKLSLMDLRRKPIFESNAEPPGDDNTVYRKCAECEHEEKVQKKSGSAEQTASSDIENSLMSSKGSGSPLPSATREQMESSFGADFSNVRIHTGSTAQGMSKDLQAQAFTHGSDIYFNSGKYDTNSTLGKNLIAHELTHVVQQNGSGAIRTSGIYKKPDKEPADDEPKITKEPKQNWTKTGFIPFSYRADRELEPPKKDVKNHPTMIWAVSKIFDLPIDEAAEFVDLENLRWYHDSSHKGNFRKNELFEFSILTVSISNLISTLAAYGKISPSAADVFDELIKLQSELSHRDYTFMLEFMKRRGVPTTFITDFKNLTPENLRKTKDLMNEFKTHKYNILDAYGWTKDYAVTKDVIRDSRFEQLKDSLFNRDLKTITDQEKDEVLYVFRDKALTTAFYALEEAKLVARAEHEKYSSNDALLQEVAEIITGYSGEFIKAMKLRIEAFQQFVDTYYDIIKLNPQALPQPHQTSKFYTMKLIASLYGGSNKDLPAVLKQHTGGKEEVIQLFSEKNCASVMAETLAMTMTFFAWMSPDQLKRQYYLPERIDNLLYAKFKEKFPKHGNYSNDILIKSCKDICYEVYPGLTLADKADRTSLMGMKSNATTKRHRFLLDVSVDFRLWAMLSVSKVKEKVMDTLKEKPDNADKTKAKLSAKPDLVWEFQPLLYHVLDKENLTKGHPIFEIVDSKIKAVSDRSFWESLALAALGLILGIAGIFTGGATTALGITLMAGAAVVSLIDFARTYDEYTTHSEAYKAIFQVPFTSEPSILSVVLSLAGVVLDLADVVKAFAKAMTAAEKAAKAGAKLAESDAAAVLLSQSKNIDEYADNLYEFLKKNSDTSGKKLLKAGISKEEFVKAVKANWEKTEKLAASWKAREAVLTTLPQDVKKLIDSPQFMELPVEIRESAFKIYDADKEAFYKITRALNENPARLKAIGFHVFDNPDMAKAYSQMSQVLNTNDFEKVIRYYSSIGTQSANALPEVLNLMNKGKIFTNSDLALQVLTNRNLQQLLLHYRGTPEALFAFWNDFVAKTGGKNAAGFADFMAKDAKYGKFTKLEEASNPKPSVKGSPDNEGLLTDMTGKPPKPKAFENLEEDISKLKQKVEDPHNIKDVTDAKYIDDYDVEVSVGNHSFRRNKTTGRWCRFTDEVCNIHILGDIDSKVEKARGPSKWSGTESVGVEPRARGYAIEDLQLEYLQKTGWRGLPDYYPRIDFFRGGKASEVVRKGKKLKEIKNADVVSVKSTKITEPEALKTKISEDLDRLKPDTFSNGDITFKNVNSKELHLVFEQGFLYKVIENEEVLKALKSMAAKARKQGVSFQWFVVPADGSIRNGPVFVREMNKVWEDI